jgi:hypothetical protein
MAEILRLLLQLPHSLYTLLILHIFFESLFVDWRLYPVHLASAALQLRVKRSLANWLVLFPVGPHP